MDKILEHIYAFDFGVLNYIQEHSRFHITDIFFREITELGDAGILWICISLLLLSCKRYRQSGIILILTLIISSVVGVVIIKPAVSRLRPFVLAAQDITFITPPGGYSFPSGHTISSVSSAVCIYKADKNAGILAVIIAALISYSRMYFYVHYPTDVLMGFLMGIIIPTILFILTDKYKPKRI